MSEANIEGNSGGAAPTRKEPDHIRRVLTIWVVLSIVGIVIWVIVSPYILPPSASDIDSAANFTLVVFTGLSIPVAMFVFVFLGYSLFVFRVKGRPTEDAIPLKPRPGLQIGWMGVTGALCLFLLIWGLSAFYQQTASAAVSPLVVKVTGQQWAWTFNYPQYGASSQGQLIELPVNRPVEFDVTSEDVLHGFAIRALGIRVDANPGEVTTTPIATPTQIGQYSVACVELCGLYHSYMWSTVKVVSASDFSSWIISQGGHP
jgi:cytochrome c oxidase subunit 2